MVLVVVIIPPPVAHTHNPSIARLRTPTAIGVAQSSITIMQIDHATASHRQPLFENVLPNPFWDCWSHSEKKPEERGVQSDSKPNV